MSRYVFSDLHGQYKLWEQIKNFLKEDDTAYFLGDAVDRGPHGIKIMKEILADKRITYLRGNHEEFVLEHAYDIIEGRLGETSYWSVRNGGASTIDSLFSMTEYEILNLCSKIRKMPEHIELDNEKGQHLYLSHAGYEPWVSDEEARLYGLKNRYTWDRKHLKYKWWEPAHYDFTLHKTITEEDVNDYENSFVIHGHTPVEYCPNPKKATWVEDLPDAAPAPFIPETVFYCGGHKIDIDMGSFYTGRVALLDLDTFETIYFDAEPEGEFVNEQ